MKITLPRKRKPRIEMLPLIDIVFLLLAVFIYTMLSMAVHHGLPVALPSSASTEIDRKLILSVTIDKDGTIFVDKQQVALEDLTDVLKLNVTHRINPGVLLFADRTISYQTLFQVLDNIKNAGLNRISLQAEAEE